MCGVVISVVSMGVVSGMGDFVVSMVVMVVGLDNRTTSFLQPSTSSRRKQDSTNRSKHFIIFDLLVTQRLGVGDCPASIELKGHGSMPGPSLRMCDADSFLCRFWLNYSAL